MVPPSFTDRQTRANALFPDVLYGAQTHGAGSVLSGFLHPHYHLCRRTRRKASPDNRGICNTWVAKRAGPVAQLQGCVLLSVRLGREMRTVEQTQHEDSLNMSMA